MSSPTAGLPDFSGLTAGLPDILHDRTDWLQPLTPVARTSAAVLANGNAEIADALFARLDSRAVSVGDSSSEDDSSDEADGAAEDGLDLWSILYGLE